MKRKITLVIDRHNPWNRTVRVENAKNKWKRIWFITQGINAITRSVQMKIQHWQSIPDIRIRPIINKVQLCGLSKWDIHVKMSQMEVMLGASIS